MSINYGVTCPACQAAIKVEISVEKLRVLVSAVGNGRVKPGITEDCPLAPPPDNGQGADHNTFHPPDPPSHTCPTCHQRAIFIDGVAAKSGKPYKAFKCNNPSCRDDGQLVPGTFRWLAQPATV